MTLSELNAVKVVLKMCLCLSRAMPDQTNVLSTSRGSLLCSRVYATSGPQKQSCELDSVNEGEKVQKFSCASPQSTSLVNVILFYRNILKLIHNYPPFISGLDAEVINFVTKVLLSENKQKISKYSRIKLTPCPLASLQFNWLICSKYLLLQNLTQLEM